MTESDVDQALTDEHRKSARRTLMWAAVSVASSLTDEELDFIDGDREVIDVIGDLARAIKREQNNATSSS